MIRRLHDELMVHIYAHGHGNHNPHLAALLHGMQPMPPGTTEGANMGTFGNGLAYTTTALLCVWFAHQTYKMCEHWLIIRNLNKQRRDGAQ